MAIRENFTDTDMDCRLNGQRGSEVECLVPDLTDVARRKILPRGKFPRDRGMRIPESGAQERRVENRIIDVYAAIQDLEHPLLHA
ncbi:hypothetical protein H7U20_28055 [Rugamonas sp. CCM 8940]|nr:hypothetical protein [Rugamonas sp. CCM 8940]MBJ7314015.1 hypothetical protein [Rugamonas sp. CCM 8940]